MELTSLIIGAGAGIGISIVIVFIYKAWKLKKRKDLPTLRKITYEAGINIKKGYEAIQQLEKFFQEVENVGK